MTGRFLETCDDYEQAWRLAGGYAETLRHLGLAGPWLIGVRRVRLRKGCTFVVFAEQDGAS